MVAVSPAGDFHKNVRRYPYDVARANEILDNLGWVDTNGDGIREDKAGNTIEFTLITNGDNSVRGAVTQRIAAGMLARSASRRTTRRSSSAISWPLDGFL